jgi:hypothetical protein
MAFTDQDGSIGSHKTEVKKQKLLGQPLSFAFFWEKGDL